MTEPSEQIYLLQEASAEIKRLRISNERMNIRLKMFDDMMLLLHNPIKYSGMSEMGLDIVRKIDKLIQSESKPENKQS